MNANAQKGTSIGRCRRWLAILALAACLAPAAAGETDRAVQPAKLRFDPQFILAEVARRMNVTLRPEVPLPAIFFESTTPLRQFQDAIAPQWHIRPHVFANAYSAARNEIYLSDDPAYYGQRDRTLDDSLAHEFAHYLQVMYQKANLEDPYLESDAVAVQLRFRQDHVHSRTVASGHRHDAAAAH